MSLSRRKQDASRPAVCPDLIAAQTLPREQRYEFYTRELGYRDWDETFPQYTLGRIGQTKNHGFALVGPTHDLREHREKEYGRALAIEAYHREDQMTFPPNFGDGKQIDFTVNGLMGDIKGFGGRDRGKLVPTTNLNRFVQRVFEDIEDKHAAIAAVFYDRYSRMEIDMTKEDLIKRLELYIEGRLDSGFWAQEAMIFVDLKLAQIRLRTKK